MGGISSQCVRLTAAGSLFPAKLRLGYGDAVLHVLNMLCDKVLVKRAIQFKTPEWAPDRYDDEMEITEGPEGDAPEDAGRSCLALPRLLTVASFPRRCAWVASAVKMANGPRNGAAGPELEGIQQRVQQSERGQACCGRRNNVLLQPPAAANK